MLIDNKGRLFGKVNIIDILIVIAIAAAIFGGYKFFTKNNAATGFTASTNKIQIQFYAEEVPEYVANSVEIGVAAKDFERNTNFGTVVNKEIEKSFSIANNSDGQYVQTSKPGYSSIKVTIEGKGVFGSTGVTIDNFEYNIGKTIILKVGKSTFQCRIYDIK